MRFGSWNGRGRRARHFVLVALVIMTSLIVACNGQLSDGQIDDEARKHKSEPLQVSDVPSRADAADLDGATVSGDVFVFVDAGGIARVDFYLDDPLLSGAPLSSDDTAPFDLGGTRTDGSGAAAPFDTLGLDDGAHTVTAVVLFRNGRGRTFHAEFVVDNASVDPSVDPVLLVSPAPSRSDPAALDGATLAGAAYVFVQVGAGVDSVDFLLDGELLHTEHDPPYDLAGTDLPSGDALPFDMSGLSDGEHILRAVARGQDGAEHVVDARFTVETSIGEPLPPVPPEPGDPSILWTAGMETGDLSEWRIQDNGYTDYICGDEYNSNGGDSVASTDIAHSGSYSVKQMITDVDSSDQGTRLFHGRCLSFDHDELYYSAWFYLPRFHTPGSFWNIFQFKSEGADDEHSKMMWALDLMPSDDDPGVLWLEARHKTYSSGGSLVGSTRYEHDTGVRVPIGEWFHIEARYLEGENGTGRVTYWQDGVLLFDFQDVTTTRPDGDARWAVNNYSHNIVPNDVVTYVDDAAISTARLGPGSTMAAELR